MSTVSAVEAKFDKVEFCRRNGHIVFDKVKGLDIKEQHLFAVGGARQID
jgi:hypothetical protein